MKGIQDFEAGPSNKMLIYVLQVNLWWMQMTWMIFLNHEKIAALH